MIAPEIFSELYEELMPIVNKVTSMLAKGELITFHFPAGSITIKPKYPTDIEESDSDYQD